MALTATTLSSAVGVSDRSVVVASATGFAAGNYVRIDMEWMRVASNYLTGTTIPVLRGQEGTATLAHVSGANVITELGSDTPSSGVPGADPSTLWSIQRMRSVTSYGVAGAIALPTVGSDAVAVINGTSTLAMTLANPTKDQDGDCLTIVSNGKGAHTVTYSAGVGNGGATMDVGTFNTTEQTGCTLMAVNGFWVLISNGIGSTGTQVAGVVWA